MECMCIEPAFIDRARGVCNTLWPMTQEKQAVVDGSCLVIILWAIQTHVDSLGTSATSCLFKLADPEAADAVDNAR